MDAPTGIEPVSFRSERKIIPLYQGAINYYFANKCRLSDFNVSICCLMTLRFAASFVFSHFTTSELYCLRYSSMVSFLVTLFSANAFNASVNTIVAKIVLICSTIHIDESARSGEFCNLNLLSPKQAVYF